MSLAGWEIEPGPEVLVLHTPCSLYLSIGLYGPLFPPDFCSRSEGESLEAGAKTECPSACPTELGIHVGLSKESVLSNLS